MRQHTPSEFSPYRRRGVNTASFAEHAEAVAVLKKELLALCKILAVVAAQSRYGIRYKIAAKPAAGKQTHRACHRAHGNARDAKHEKYDDKRVPMAAKRRRFSVFAVFIFGLLYGLLTCIVGFYIRFFRPLVLALECAGMPCRLLFSSFSSFFLLFSLSPAFPFFKLYLADMFMRPESILVLGFFMQMYMRIK